MKRRRTYREKRPRPGPMQNQRRIPSSPCYHTALLHAGLIQRNTSIPAAFELFSMVTRQPEVQTAREKVLQRMQTTPTAPFAVSVAALKLLSAEEIRNIKLRLNLCKKREQE